MKILILVTVVIALCLTGCSSTYKISDYSSKEKFYEDFNKAAYNKIIKIILNNDSSFTNINGAKILNDTLYYFGKEFNSAEKKFSLLDTKEINYSNLSHTSATLILNSGEIYKAEDIKTTQDSIYFVVTNEVIVQAGIVPVDKIWKISYKNHWLGIPGGFILGSLGGLITGLLVEDTIPADNANQDRALAVIIGTPLGALIGSIIGWIDGYSYTYIFNP
jgi:hypothetical protein